MLTLQAFFKPAHSLLLVLGWGCAVACSPASENQPGRSLRQEPAGSASSQARRWRSDSLGCQGIRTRALADTLLRQLQLAHADKAAFLAAFGKPNKEMALPGRVLLSYRCGASCAAGRLADSTEFCSADYYFQHNRLATKLFVCQ